MTIARRKRLMMRLAGVRISPDGRRWTAPRKREALLSDVFERVLADAWREDKTATIERGDDGVTLVGPKGRIELRWRG